MLDKIKEIIEKYNAITEQLGDSAIASNPKQYSELAKQHSELDTIVLKGKEYIKLSDELEENEAILAGDDDELIDIVRSEIEELKLKHSSLEDELKLLLIPKDPRKNKNVIVEIRAGTGGEEAALFAADLFRMYNKFTEKKGWSTKVLSSHETGNGGLKEVIFSIQGKGAFGELKFEGGVHRVQRVPETESSGRIHTSAATVAVLTEVDEIDLDIDSSDLRIDTFRASGAGGQHVNKIESAIRITHIPSGLVVTCQDEKSQHKNKTAAMKVLRARLKAIEEEKQHQKIAAERKSMISTGDRSAKIRTYNFPQGRVTDHRINLTLYKLDAILQGDLSELIGKLLLADQVVLLQTN
tara:strand:- start:40231 stop:41292 length:1062 start_codon:yes stop_codon:yes gene_type:complete